MSYGSNPTEVKIIFFYLVCTEVGRIRTFPFSSDSTYDSVAYDPVKTRSTESQGEA